MKGVIKSIFKFIFNFEYIFKEEFKLKIVISAGHGPETPGKRSPDGFREFSFTYPTAEYVCQYLNEYENVQILKVYDKNRDVPLSERTNKANSWGADLYQSIHANAFGNDWNDAHGIETLVKFILFMGGGHFNFICKKVIVCKSNLMDMVEED
jgi:hypothetical protein